MGFKENDGRGRQRQLLRKLNIVASLLLLVAVVLLGTLLWTNNDNDNTIRLGDERRRTLLKGMRRKAQQQHNNNNKPRHVDTDWQAILNGQLHLVELHVGDLEGEYYDNHQDIPIAASFCRLDWDLHKNDPSTYPMFRDLVGKSEDCLHHKVRVDLHDIVAAARETTTTKVLELRGVVFHESRCGSTLTANLLASWKPQQHRVYSESTPPIQVLTHVCGDEYDYCSVETAAKLLQDVVFLMSRTDRASEESVFFKIQSAGSRHVEIFQTAFETVPYLFVYRDPVQVLMSHLKHGVHSANCLRHKRHPPHDTQRLLDVRPAQTPHDHCAAHLATLTGHIVQTQNEHLLAVNYNQLPDKLYDTIFPLLYNGRPSISSSELERMQTVATIYSKGRGEKAGLKFEEDSERKEEMANDKVRAAARAYLQESYEALEALAV